MGDPAPGTAGQVGGGARHAAYPPPAAVLRPGRAPDLFRLLRRERAAGRPRPHPFRARPHPGRGPDRGRDPHLDRGGRPAPARALACARAVAAPPPRHYRFPVGFSAGMRPSSQGPTGADMAGVGFYFAAAALLPILGGVGLDAAFHTSPVFVLVGLVVGLAAGAAAVWLKIREFTR
ncbi:MAG: hypothetical protein E6I36_07995 [Chloroflexi bacterium]|nr:MAG: hypothetical protein E6I36_07995 [Chloroflexota bacterium]